MKNEKKVSAEYHKIFDENDKVRSKWYILPEIDESPEIISAFSYDYIREDKCVKWEKIGKINGVDIEYCKYPPEEELKVGDVVVLRSGGPIITVMCKDDEDEHHFYCGYFYNGEYKESEFWDNVLEKVEKEHIGCDRCELDCDKIDYDICNNIDEKELAKKVAEKANFEFNENKRWAIPQIAFAEGAWWMYNELTK